jgi:hypothetical protein
MIHFYYSGIYTRNLNPAGDRSNSDLRNRLTGFILSRLNFSDRCTAR